MNTQLKILTLLLLLHAAAYSAIPERAPLIEPLKNPALVEQPKLSAEAEYLFHIHQLATQAHKTSLDELSKLTPEEKKSRTFHIDLDADEQITVQKPQNKVTDIAQDLVNIGTDLVKKDPEHFKLVDNQLYRKVLTDSSGKYEWILSKDYENLAPQDNTLIKIAKHPEVIKQPKLNARAEYLFHFYESQRQTTQKTLAEYNKLTPAQQNGIKFDWNSPLFIKPAHPTVEAHGNATDNLNKTMNLLAKEDPENFKLIDGDIYRKLLTNSSGKYIWIPCKDYTKTITNPDTFKNVVQAHEDAEKKAAEKKMDPEKRFEGFDPVSREAIENIEILHPQAEDFKKRISDYATNQYNIFMRAISYK